MPMISDFKANITANKTELQSSVPSGTQEKENKNLEFADFMHRKLQDLDLMLMKDKGVTTITKLILQFDDRIKGRINKTFAQPIPKPQLQMFLRL